MQAAMHCATHAINHLCMHVGTNLTWVRSLNTVDMYSLKHEYYIRRLRCFHTVHCVSIIYNP